MPLIALLLAVQLTEARWELPPGVLVGVVMHESRGREKLITRERDGHCSVGPAQVLVRGCARARVLELLELQANLDAGAAVLVRSAAICAKHPRWSACRRSRFALYNAGSRTWWSGVQRWRRWFLNGARPLRARGGEA